MYDPASSHKSNLVWGIALILILLSLGTILLIVGLTQDIQDLLILGSIFLAFFVLFVVCICSFIFRPIYNARKVQSAERDAAVENVGFSGSDDELEKITNSFVKIRVGADDVKSVTTETDADNVIVDVKSRASSATSAAKLSGSRPNSKSVTFY
ncbi:hypothetical protein FSP39_016985 [Pinctada imbricata]|uniref:Uncharacterized protein n=1 Tax=Pinctada imbricata TaxID=66713 RepID=A0AA88XZI3_PINIB|nr:hypothetical protein FSP39_016985 [Pinctada imbricata]